MRTPDNEARSSFWPGFFVGGMVGVALGILLAPRPGAETRARLMEQAADAMERGMSGDASNLWETFDEVREILREAIAEGREVIREAVAEGRQASARTEDELRHRYGQATGREP